MHTPVMPAFKWRKQENEEFKANLGFMKPRVNKKEKVSAKLKGAVVK